MICFKEHCLVLVKITMHVLSHEHQEIDELFCLTFNVEERGFWKEKCDYLYVLSYSLHFNCVFLAHAAVFDCRREELSDFILAYLRECDVSWCNFFH